MNLQKLFEMQRVLDANITAKHPIVEGEDRLSKKILALQVELAELAQEWRGFKFWSNDQEARTYVPYPKDLCKACDGQGYTDKHLDIKQWKFCKECDGCGAHYHNPLLEEYVDVLHFVLSIGLEIGCTPVACDVDLQVPNRDINKQFLAITGELLKIPHNLSYKAEREAFNNYHRVLGIFNGLGKMLGFTWDEIEAAYYAKNDENHARQARGY